MMLKSARNLTRLAAIALLGVAASSANASVTIQSSIYQLGGSTESNTLAANGWVGVLLTATSNGNPVGGFDLFNNSGGITGTFEQAKILTNSTPTGTLPITAPGSTVDLRDSFFSSFTTPTNFNFSAVDALTENNNGSSHAASPLQTVSHDYSFAPLTDDATFDYGIGTSLTGSGAFKANQSTSVPLAFVIVPAGSTIHVVGTFTDVPPSGQSSAFPVNASIIAAVPEPASVGIMAIGAASLFARRRRKA